MRGLAAAALLAALCAAAQAQVLFKWTDADGKVHYADQPPKGFKGEVTRIVPDAPVAGAPATPAAPKVVAPADGVKPPDIARERRERREKLQARLDAARARVEAARLALAQGEESREEDRRVIQQRMQAQPGMTGAQQIAPNADPTQGQLIGGGMHGMTSRGNCRTAKDAAGNNATVCAASLLSQDYYDRVEKLQADLRKAEEDLTAAEDAYRRGVD